MARFGRMSTLAALLALGLGTAGLVEGVAMAA